MYVIFRKSPIYNYFQEIMSLIIPTIVWGVKRDSEREGEEDRVKTEREGEKERVSVDRRIWFKWCREGQGE